MHSTGLRSLTPLAALVAACHAAPRARASAEHALAARVAGCYAVVFAPPDDAWMARLRDRLTRVNLAAHGYVELRAPAARYWYGQLSARPPLDSAATDYVRPAWVPLPPDSVVVFWDHVWSRTLALEVRLKVTGESLEGRADIASDLSARPELPRGPTVVARRTRCRVGHRAADS